MHKIKTILQFIAEIFKIYYVGSLWASKRPSKIWQSTFSWSFTHATYKKTGCYLIRFSRYSSLKNTAIWLAESIFGHYLRTRFFINMGFSQKVDNNYGTSFKPQKGTHQWTNFFVKSKKHHFWGIFGHYPQNEIFFKKSSSITFLPLTFQSPNNSIQSFRKLLWVVFEKNGNWLTDWQEQSHRTPIRLKTEVQKIKVIAQLI